MNAVWRTPSRWKHDHGDQCGCRLLASAVGADASTVDFTFCRFGVQKRWRVRCNHGGGVSATRATPELPSHDPRDAVQAILIANAISRVD